MIPKAPADRPMQPGVKRRGPEHIRPKYRTEPRLEGDPASARNLTPGVAIRENALDIEAWTKSVPRRTGRRADEAMVAEPALEPEPIDP